MCASGIEACRVWHWTVHGCRPDAEAVPRLNELNEVQRNRILMRPVPVNDDVPWTPPAVAVPADFMRYCSDDLKAMYLEGRIAMKPAESPDQALRWLWGETALGALLADVKDQMQKSPEHSIRDAAFGIAR